jgi:hypothetical protein
MTKRKYEKKPKEIDKLLEIISQLTQANIAIQQTYLSKIDILLDKLMARDYLQYKTLENPPVSVPEPQEQPDLTMFDDDWNDEVKG